MANLQDQRGRSLRAGVAGVKRILTDPDKLCDDDKKPGYAMVWNNEKGKEVYISRDEPGKKPTFNVTWWKDDKEQSRDFKDRDEAIKFFLGLVKK